MLLSVTSDSAIQLAQAREVLVNGLDHHRAFADRRCDALDRAAAHVAHCEDAGQVGLVGRESASFPLIGTRPGRDRRWAGPNKPFVVERDRSSQPCRARIRPDHHEQGTRPELSRSAGRPVDHSNTLEPFFAANLSNLRVQTDHDVQCVPQTGQQIFRHAQR